MLQALWLVLTYSYNAILVLFIATHLFVGAIISFLTGLYIGVYLTQNYEIPRINEPRRLWDKFLSFLEKNRRDPQKVSIGNILKPTTIKGLVVLEAAASPPKTETTSVPCTTGSVSLTQTESQTEPPEAECGEEDIIDENTTENEIELTDAMSDGNPETDTDTTLTAHSTSSPESDHATTLILTEPEDITEDFKSICSPQIVEASLTLNKDKAISRSNSKLNL